MMRAASPESTRPNEYFDKPGHECGVVGVFSVGGVSNVSSVYQAMNSLQHRGQSGAGLTAYHPELGHMVYKGNGVVRDAIAGGAHDVANNIEVFETYKSPVVLGHTRYSTSPNPDASQPFDEGLAVVHNGHVEGTSQILKDLGINPDLAMSDSHALTLAICAEFNRLGDLHKAINSALDGAEGAYCLLISDGQSMTAVRDPWGIHPLVLGELPDGKAMVASEAAAIRDQGGTLVRNIRPGEILTISADGHKSSEMDRAEKPAFCSYELGYMLRGDGITFLEDIGEEEPVGVEVHAVRKELGKLLAETAPVEADVVIGIPSSGLSSAQGFAEASGLPLVAGIEKNPYAGRSFILDGADRAAVLRNKFRFNRSELEGRRVVLVDDSLIKGNTMMTLVELVRAAGASEVHVRLSMPEYRHPCYMGMDTSAVD